VQKFTITESETRSKKNSKELKNGRKAISEFAITNLLMKNIEHRNNVHAQSVS